MDDAQIDEVLRIAADLSDADIDILIQRLEELTPAAPDLITAGDPPGPEPH